MNAYRTTGRVMLLTVCFGLGSLRDASGAPSTADNQTTNEIRIVELQGQVEIIRKGATIGVQTSLTNQLLQPFDRLRTGPKSRVALLWGDQSVVPFGASTEIEILPPQTPGEQSGLHLIKGILSFFHRDKPGRIRVITRGAVAGVKGTEFVVAVEPTSDAERTTIWVIDGTVSLDNDHGTLVVTNGQSAVAEVGKPPRRTAGFIANNVLQWCFYYPAVLNPDELALTQEEKKILDASLAAYRSGDLIDALASYPAGRRPGSDAERIYYAALLLSVGEVERTEDTLAALATGEPSQRLQRLAAALRQLIAGVKRQPSPATVQPELSTEFLAASYYEQSRATHEDSLRAALDLAKNAVTNSTGFGFAWERLAELEFSFGHTDRALKALNNSLAFAGRNAQGLALKGFLQAAQNKTGEAIDRFNEAITADSALGNAWLGRGLCRIRRGDLLGGREDLLVAAALEPQRAVLRSYLGKAYADAKDPRRAAKELQLAKGLDSNDPTAWLYTALLNQQNNRINEGIRDLEKSQELNNNRAVYRSQLLLDQDRAMRSANLARIYQDAGMEDVAVREAGRAVNYDYANYSAHLFLANSYDQIRDPNHINLRYETPANGEYLLANLLAPVGAGILSPQISQQEYSKLFERNGLGVVSSTEYLSRGAWTESGAQYGTFGNTSYSFDAFYRTDPGQRPNNDVEQRHLALSIKQQITPQDTVYLQVSQYESEGGDLFQYYDPASSNPGFRYEEEQEPLLLAGYHHEWNPGAHTLFMFGRYDDTFEFTDPREYVLVDAVAAGEISAVRPLNMHQRYGNSLDIYSTELQQIWQTPNHATILGILGQWGEISLSNLQTEPSELAGIFNEPPADQDFSVDFNRVSLYGYHHWQVLPSLRLIGGLTCDWLTFPANARLAPLSKEEESVSEVSPKAGVIWTPSKGTVMRAAYSRSLAGASLDQSARLEPTQVAGFNQSFRSLIPESVAGANAGERFEILAASLEQRFPTQTYLSLGADVAKSDVHRTVGSFELNTDVSDYAFESGLREHLDFEERSLLFTADQLLGDGWSVGLRYRLTRAEIQSDFVGVTDSALVFEPFDPRQEVDSLLHQLNFHLNYNHPCGFFAQFEAIWNHQSNEGDVPQPSGDDFWQCNLFAGYRFLHRRIELGLGLLNLTDQDYRLNPLTLYYDMARERTFVTRLKLAF